MIILDFQNIEPMEQISKNDRIIAYLNFLSKLLTEKIKYQNLNIY